MTYRDRDGLFSTELPSGWKFQGFRQTIDPNYPIERGVIFAAADSPVLPAVSKSATDPAAIGNAVAAAEDLVIAVFIARSDLGHSPREFATSEESKSVSQAGYRFIALKSLPGLDGYEFAYRWDRNGVPVTVVEAFVVSHGHMLLITASAMTSVYERQSAIVSHFLSRLRTS